MTKSESYSQETTKKIVEKVVYQLKIIDTMTVRYLLIRTKKITLIY